MTTDTALQIVHLPIDDLKPDPANPRRIADEEQDALTRGIREFGLVQPIVVRRENLVVIGGHQRLIAARRLGMKTVPCILLDVSEEQARLLGLGLNRIGGDWDQQLLARMVADLRAAPDVDITLSGFGEDELSRLLKKMNAEEKRYQRESFDLDAALAEAVRAPITKSGDLWLLGDHRLLCGDSTSRDDVVRLMDGKLATLFATDPPYLVDYTAEDGPPSRSRKGKHKTNKNWDKYKDPNSSVEFFRQFLELGLEHCLANVAIYQWHASRRQALVEEAWRACGLLIHQTIVWVKARGIFGRSHYRWAHEPCFYGWREGRPPERKPPANERTVWQVDQQGELNGVHPTQKPVELFLRPIEFHTEAGDIVYEPFSGSGTQIIAAERSGRICYAVEQEPRYVDVAMLRWEAFTGEKARRLEEAR